MHPGHPVSIVVIDDEMNAILLLEEMLTKIDGVTVNGNATDVKSGVSLILNCRPDIVFLDIRLKEERGFDLIRELKNYDLDPFIVMVTGYDQFALEAIKAGAFDYLLKPVDPNELLKVISRYRKKHAQLNQAEPAKKIRFNTLGGFILIDPDKIIYCKAEANYTDIFLTSKHKYTISLNIGSVEKILEKAQFFRISRSCVINIKYLTEINRGKRLCTLSVNQLSYPLCIAHERIKDLEEYFLH